jgi:aryl-alcohol dehydrogenase-like predicted oxidoreductase
MNRRELLAAGVTLMAAPSLTRPAVAAVEAALIRRKIPSSGEELPVIGLGTSGPFEISDTPGARAPLAQVLTAFFAGGGCLIDTSPMYSTAEQVLGELLTPQMHQEVFLATKVWTRGRAAGIEQMTRSAELMKVPRLDLIQVHNLLDLDTQLATLREWKAAGRVRYLGVTHYTVSSYPDLARVIERERIDFVQFNYSPVTREAEQRLLPLCAERGVAVAGQPAVRGRRAVSARARPRVAALGGGGRRRELGTAGAEVHRLKSRRHLHHSRDRQRRAPQGQPRRRTGTAPRYTAARGHRPGVCLTVWPARRRQAFSDADANVAARSGSGETRAEPPATVPTSRPFLCAWYAVGCRSP